jgi:soluble lytic murein transglycosylase
MSSSTSSTINTILYPDRRAVRGARVRGRYTKGRANGFRALDKFLKANDSSLLLAKFLTIALLLLCITIAYFVSYSNDPIPEVVSAAESAFRGNPSYSERVNSNREKYRSQLSQSKAKRRETAKQISYVDELIRSYGKKGLSAHESKKLARAIVEVSGRVGVDPLFVTAVIKAESRFNRHAISPVGAKGLMQIMPDTGRYISKRHKLSWRGESSLHEIDYNIELGATYLKELEKRFKGDREMALIAYNWGPGNLLLAKKGEKNIPTISKTYASKVIFKHQSWSKAFLAQSLAAKNASSRSIV